MYTSLEIKGFRCFKHLKIDKLARINLIGGKNNTGKTALLEAIYIAARAGIRPDTLFHDLCAVRGLTPDTASRLGHGALFTGFDLDASATIEVTGLGDEPVVVKLEGNGFQETVALSVNDVQTGVVHFREGALGGSRHQAGKHVPCRILASRDRLPDRELAGLFGELQINRQTARIAEALKRLEPDVAKVETVILRGGVPLFHVDLGDDRPLAPLPLVGEGMNRVASILLAATNVRDGLLLIDEIENGLHYSVMPDVWRTVAETAADLNVQVFATTHSHECIEAAAAAVEEVAPGGFLYHRLDRVDGEVVCRRYRPEVLEAAFQTELEVR